MLLVCVRALVALPLIFFLPGYLLSGVSKSLFAQIVSPDKVRKLAFSRTLGA